MLATFRITHGGYPYHLALMQLEHDASFRMHCPFDSMSGFPRDTVDRRLRQGRPRAITTWCSRPIRWKTARPMPRRKSAAWAASTASPAGSTYVRGGKLAQLLDQCPHRGVTVNSNRPPQQVL